MAEEGNTASAENNTTVLSQQPEGDKKVEGQQEQKPGEQKPGEQKPGEQKPEDNKKPEEGKKEEKKSEAPTIDSKAFKMPEGFKANDEQIKGFVDLLANPEVTPQQKAQSLLDMHAKALKDLAAEPKTTWDNTVQQWSKEVAENKDYGSGDPKTPLKPEAKAAVSKLIDQFGGPKLREALDITGAGSSPALVDAFVKIAKILTEGNHISGQPPSNKATGPGAAALYGDLPP